MWKWTRRQRPIYIAVLFYEYSGKDDGITYEFDLAQKAWFPRLTAEILEAQQSIYRVEGVDDTVTFVNEGSSRKTWLETQA